MPTGLRQYRAKRDFSKSPEPAGRKRARATRLGFVVQKHSASHLHYDFRLEHAGTLKSWAVPKGPSLDPKVSRLAVEVEDHPLEYASFEGTIPKGQYGGGSVIVWDQGTWEPAEDAAQGLRKGKLHFRLHGQKLRGGFILIRTGKDARKPQWLLRKLEDAEARSGEIVEERPESVLSGRGIEAKKAALPRFVAPELATLVSEPPAGDEWLHEIKLDGYRALCRIASGKVRFLSRSGQDRTQLFGRLAEAAASLEVESALLDGEVVCLKPDGRSDFQTLQQALGAGDDTRLYYWAFDLLHLDGKDLTRTPLLERKRLLEALLAPKRSAERIRFSAHVLGDGRDFWRQACRMSVEGIVSKRGDSPYRSSRTRDWLKVKCLARQEFVIVGFTEPRGSRSGLGALLVAVHDARGKLRYAGKVGTGFDRTSLLELRKRLERLVRATSPLQEGRPRERGVRWVRPQLVAEIAFTEWTRDGILRHPSYQGLREDKPARKVVRERALPVSALSASRPAPPRPRARPRKRSEPSGRRSARGRA